MGLVKYVITGPPVENIRVESLAFGYRRAEVTERLNLDLGRDASLCPVTCPRGAGSLPGVEIGNLDEQAVLSELAGQEARQAGLPYSAFLRHHASDVGHNETTHQW